jgi:hypothetical protein
LFKQRKAHIGWVGTTAQFMMLQEQILSTIVSDAFSIVVSHDIIFHRERGMKNGHHFLVSISTHRIGRDAEKRSLDDVICRCE